MGDFTLGVAGFSFADLYRPDRLGELWGAFWKFVQPRDSSLWADFRAHGGLAERGPTNSEVLLRVARQLDTFLAQLFRVENELGQLRRETAQIQQVFAFKEEFWSNRVLRQLETEPVGTAEFAELESQVQELLRRHTGGSDVIVEPAVAALGLDLFRASKQLADAKLPSDVVERMVRVCQGVSGSDLSEQLRVALDRLVAWGIQVYVDPERRSQVAGWASYVRPHKLDFDNLVQLERPRADLPEFTQGPDTHLRHRDGFHLTDERMKPAEYLREVDYCILCHPRQKDSCSLGLREKDGRAKKNPLQVLLEGCPLDERISEMHTLRKEGYVLGALAMIMLDNPMCPGTGHRICNDCMKGCIYQKQEPVNIPQIETGVLTEVLQLPYGFEIYSLLTRFNPLNRDVPYAQPYNGVDVLVVGLGPAGYTLAHYLTQYGFGVVGIDGLKFEPVDDELTGRGLPFPRPIKDFRELTSDLATRVSTGFGGVSEYGITVRWDKNFLQLIYLTLLRRRNLRAYGGVRLGGTFLLEDAWQHGFAHVALATGAGRPTIIDMKNNLIRGVRKASDFLMALQLTGAFKQASLANLQMQLPAIVVGGGLTAIDTATELLAYYPLQVEKTLEIFESLSATDGEESVWRMCDEEEREILTTFLAHGRAVRNERELAAAEGRAPNFVQLCREWGGVAIAYRKKLSDSPAYRLNHEEVTKALEEGISFIENMVPVEAQRDRFGALEAVRFQRSSGEEVALPAKSLLVAAGTSPNTIYEREYPGTFEFDRQRKFFRKYRADRTESGSWELVPAEDADREAFLLSYSHEGRFVSYYGDNHPNYAGNVVKAMASAKHGSKQIARLFAEDLERAQGTGVSPDRFQKLVERLDDELQPRVVRVDRLTPTIVEVIVRAPYCARKFEPGQFYRLQNFESQAPVVDGKRLALEGLALTGAWVDKEQGLLSMIVLEMGVSSRLCATLQPGQPLVVMGPTGAPSEIPQGETVLLAGGGLGNAVLFSISRALRNNGCRVIYFAGYRSKRDLFKQAEIEAGTDVVIWAVDSGEPIEARRPQDGSFVGNIVQAMLAYAQGQLTPSVDIPLDQVDRIFAIGSDRMMAAVTAARHQVLRPYLKPGHLGIASINSLMQCMMKEVCAQCLQKHVDPATGCETEAVFSCFNQDQEMDRVDFQNLRERLKSNSLAEKLTNRYFNSLLPQLR